MSHESRRSFRLLFFAASAAACTTTYDAAPAGSAPAERDAFYVPPVPRGCDEASLPTEAPCTIHESIAVFVSSAGKDTNAGTRTSPLRTIATGIRIAELTGRRVYVCAQPFDEPISFREGVSLFGYFECTGGWKVSGTARARIQPHAHVIAARARGIVRPTRVEAFEVLAADGGPGESSIALVAEQSPGLSFHRTALRAGRGGDGVPGTMAPIAMNDGAAEGDAGDPLRFIACDASCVARRRTRTRGGSNTCGGALPSGTGVGGEGGRAGFVRYRVYQAGDPPLCYPDLVRGRELVPFCYFPDPGQPMESGLPIVTNVQTARGASFGYTLTVDDHPVRHAMLAENGAAGKDGRNGENGKLGTFSASGYAGGGGSAGGDGMPGQGGGGGTAQVPSTLYIPGPVPYDTAFAAMGGGGGAGGCGGRAGGPGGGGGASIALVAIESGLVVDAASTLEAKMGGLGGEGTFGSDPTEGGLGGAGTESLPETRGGRGGRGGLAGFSGHGASGPSIGVAWSKVRPLWLTSPVIGPSAPARPSRTRGSVVIPEGARGLRAEELSF